MAKKVYITDFGAEGLQIYVDNRLMTNVQSYKLEKDKDGCRLSLVIGLTDSLNVTVSDVQSLQP